MVKNHILKDMRINEETNKMLDEASNGLGIKKTDLARLLLNKSLKKLKSDSIKVGGFENLDITISNN